MEKVKGPLEIAIQNNIRQGLNVTELLLVNESHMHSRNPKGESHFNLLVVSPDFENKKLVERHRQVQALLADQLASGLHAVTLRTLTPEEWSKDPANLQSPACSTSKTKT